MGREVFIVRDGAVVWRGLIPPSVAKNGGVLSAQQYFEEAWRQALKDRAVAADDAGAVQFRFSAP